MLILKNYILISIIATLALVSNASAGLYGFSAANPLTPEERILNIDNPPRKILNFRQEMRQNINMLADYAHSRNADFQIILHEGEQLLNKSLWEYHLEGYNQARQSAVGSPDPSFLYQVNTAAPENSLLAGQGYPKFQQKINAIALNNVFCSNRKLSHVLKQSNLKLIAIDHCPDEDSFDEAIQESFGENMLLHGFTDLGQAFNNIRRHPIINENAQNISEIAEAKNILVLDDDSHYSQKYDLIRELQNSNYDLIIIPPLFHGKTPYSTEEIHSLKFKKNGATRLIMAEMNLSEADPSSYYWKKIWQTQKPSWLARPSLVNESSYITRFWDPDWKKIISAHLQSIVNTGFSGVFFTGLQNHLYFEKRLPLE